MSGNEFTVAGEYERLRSQFVILKNDEGFSDWKSQVVMSNEDCGIAECDTFKTVYHLSAAAMLTRLEGMR
jgi:hypothetical protein